MNPSKHLTSFLRLRNQLVKTRVSTFTARTPSSTRTMASTSNPLNPQVESEPSSEQQSSQSQQPETSSQSQPSQSTHTPLPLPASPSDATQLNVNGEGVKLDHLGPLVVNKDGTLSRIANWNKMAEIEKKNTLRILGKEESVEVGGFEGAGRREGVMIVWYC